MVIASMTITRYREKKVDFTLPYFQDGEGLLVKLLSVAPLVLLGEASYSLYILHVPIMFWVAVISDAAFKFPAFENLAIVLTTMVAMQVLALITYKLVELPARRALKAQLLMRLFSGS